VPWWDKIIFYPVDLMLFTVISKQTKNMSGVFIQVFMTHTIDLVTYSNLKMMPLFSETIFFDRKWRKQQHKRKLNKICSSNYGPKVMSYRRAESQEHAAWRKICEEVNSRIESNKLLN